MVLSPDQLHLCLTIIGDGNQDSGLQVFETQNSDRNFFIKLPLADKVVVSPGGDKAYVSAGGSIYPVDLVNYTYDEQTIISWSGTVGGMAAAYRLQT